MCREVVADEVSPSVKYHGDPALRGVASHDGTEGYRLLGTEYVGGKTIFHIALRDEKRRCVHCGSKWVLKAGKFRRTFRSVPIGLRSTCLVLHGHQHRCQRCRRIGREGVLFADTRRRYSRSLARMVVELASYMALVPVAVALRVGWDVVKQIFFCHLRRKLKRRRLSFLPYIAADEFALRKGHRYITLVMAIVNKAIDDVRKGLYRELSAEQRKVLKACRYLLLKGLEKLKPSALERLWDLMEINQPLCVAYLLKEDLRRFWDFRDLFQGGRFPHRLAR